jgi:dTMP kinase
MPTGRKCTTEETDVVSMSQPYVPGGLFQMPGVPQPPIRPKKYIGHGLPYVDLDDLTGQLLVIEGSDGVGRSTQISLLKSWLEIRGFGVVETGWTRSNLVGATIDVAKEGHGMNVLTFNLLYATDFADRLEHDVIPALRSGFVVLADRYTYTALARAAARGADVEWVKSLFGFAIEPDLVIYLKVDTKTLVRRVIASSRLDYWEAGMDQNPGCDPYDSLVRYQTKVLREFNRLAKQYNFRKVDARHEVARTQRELRKHVAEALEFELTEQDLEIENERGARP